MSCRDTHWGAVAAALLAACLLPVAGAQLETDYSKAASPFPHIYKPYISQVIPGPDLSNAANARLAVENGKLRLSLAQLAALVLENNLTVASARYYPSIAQVDLLRARSGNSPRGVDVSQIPSGVFAGAVGGSTLGTTSAAGSGASKAGGITGSAGSVRIRPAGVFDPTFNVSFSMDRTTSPLNTLVVAGVPSVNTHTGAFSASYVQDFAFGTSISFTYGIQRQASTQKHLVYDPDFTPGFTATVSQQLLNGFGSSVSRALIKVAGNEQKIERESFRQQATSALASAQNTYWDLVAAQGAVRSAEKALAAARQLEQQSRKEFEIGTMASLDVVSAQSQVAASQRDLIVTETNVEIAELQLKAIISKNLEEPLASASIETTDPLPDAEAARIPTVEEASALALQNRPELAIAEGNIKSDMDAQPFMQSALRPTLNVFGVLTTVGLYNVFGTSFRNVVEFKYPEIAFGLNLSFSLHNRQAQADEVRSRLELKQAKDTLARSRNQVSVDVKNAVIALTQSQARVSAAREAMRLEQRTLEAEQAKFTAGLSTSYNVILVQRDLFSAELAELQARDAFARAGVTLAQATGTTLESNHVTLDEALRGEVAAAR